MASAPVRTLPYSPLHRCSRFPHFSATFRTVFGPGVLMVGGLARGSAPMDFDRYQNLHTIIMLRDILRKWWRSELTFATKDGVVAEWAKGQIAPPPNDFCRLSLFSKEGFHRCTSSVR